VWSPKGDAIALARGKSIALVRPIGRLLRTIQTSSNVEAITWSPNTTQLAYLSKLPVGEPVPRTVPRRLLVTVSATGRSARTVARFDRFQLTKLLGWLREGYVLYQTTREVNDLDVFSAGSDGGDVRQLTDDDVPQVDPAWSPDGGQVVFSEGNAEFRRYELRTMLVGATTSTRLTVGKPDESDVEPAWSPDGTLIAFTRLAGAAAFDANVFVVRSDGTGLAQVTHGGGRSPAWWPDGRHLVFSRTENFRPVLYSIAADGSGERRLFQGGWGAPSRDGARIAYAALDAANQIGLWVANADGSEPRRIANDPASAPSWSPDGTTLVFQRSVAPAQGRLAIVDITGGDETLLAHVGADDEAPDWSRTP
jgi:Tol biopolymer transport system component